MAEGSDSHVPISSEQRQQKSDGLFSYRAAESLMRITLAGFGGALVGLSMARRQRFVSVSSSSTVLQRRRHLTYDDNLPNTWAIACSSFIGIIEICRWVSPTAVLLSTYNTSTKNDVGRIDHKEHLWLDEKSIRIMGDFTIGGAMAGAIFKGSHVGSTPATTRLQASGGGKKIVSGLIMGMTLGLLAGMTEMVATRLQDDMIDKMEREEETRTMTTRQESEHDDLSMEEDDDIVVRQVKGMSIEELEDEIEALRGNPMD